MMISLNSKSKLSTNQLNIGLKLFSTNLDLLPAVRRLEKGSPFAFIELYIIPGSFRDTSEYFERISLPVIIHSPHFAQGANLADPALRERNRQLMEDSFRFADLLDARWIIAHGGMNGTLEEVIFQVRKMNDLRIILENLPITNLLDEPSVGCTPEDMAVALDSGAFGGFVLDVGHAICAAASLKCNWQDYLNQFLNLTPCMFHIADGDIQSEKDMHLSLGSGNYDWDTILPMLPKESLVTLETPRDPVRGLADSEADALFIKRMLTKVDVS